MDVCGAGTSRPRSSGASERKRMDGFLGEWKWKWYLDRWGIDLVWSLIFWVFLTGHTPDVVSRL